MAQLLRQGLDEAPHFLAEARTKLLDPQERIIQKPFTADALLDRVRAAMLTPQRVAAS